MLRTLVYLCVAQVLVVLGKTFVEHEELSREVLDELASSLSNVPNPASRRDLAQQWTQFNNYFSGTGTTPPLSYPTYWGQAPGPCNLAGNQYNNNPCSGAACDMDANIRAIIICPNPIPSWLISCKRVDAWINCDDCTNYPGWVYLYNTDFGNIHLGGIYLDVITASPADIVVPLQGFTSPPTPYLSELPYRNQFRMNFTLSELQFDMVSLVDISKLQLKSPLTFTLSKTQVGITLARASQTISSTNHAVSFQTTMIFRANQQCQTRSPRSAPTVVAGLDTTCIYRSDKVTPGLPSTRANYYRGISCSGTTNCRTESYLEGVVYDINLPRTPTANPASWTAATPFDSTACLFDFSNNYASVSPGTAHTTALGLSIDIGPLCNFCFCIVTCCYDVCRILLNLILNLIIAQLVESILCQLFEGLFYQSTGTTNPVPTSTRGLANIGILNLYTFFRGYVETALTTMADENLEEDVTMPQKFVADGYTWPNTNCAITSYCPYPPAVDFNASAIFKAFSLGINGILGNVSTTPSYQAQGKLTIVEVIDILSGNTDGVFKLGICPPNDPPSCDPNLGICTGTCDGDIKQELKLDYYPNFTWSGYALFDGSVVLNGMLISYANSITKLNILDNGFENNQPLFTHTLTNALSMDRFALTFDFWLTLFDGTWVHRPRYQIVPTSQKRSIPMRTQMYVELDGITLNIDMFALLRPDLISPKKIGGVFGNFPDGSLTDRFRCAAFGLDMLQFPKLEVRGSLGSLTFNNFVGDLGTVITQGVTIFNLGYYQATNLYLTFLSNNWARPLLNSYLMNNTYDGKCGPKVNGVCTRPNSLDYCPPTYPYYFAANDPNRYINFYDSQIWNLVKNVINNVVGGIPVRTGAASINSIIDAYLQWYVPGAVLLNVSLALLPNQPNAVPPQMGNIDILYKTVNIQGTINGGQPDPDRYVTFSNFGLRNIETIHELSIEPTLASVPQQFRLDFKLGGGKIYDRVNQVYISNGLFQFKFHMATEVSVLTQGVLTTYAMDEADFFFNFGNITVGTDIYALVNQNTYLDLTFGEMTVLACLLALVDSFNMIDLSIGFQQFGLTIARQSALRNRDRHCDNKWDVVTCPGTTPCPFVSVNCYTPCIHNGSPLPSIVVRFSDALDRLAWEAQTWGAVVNNMVQYFFNGVASVTRDAINSFAAQRVPVATCSTYDLFAGTPLGFITGLFSNASSASDSLSSFLELLSAPQSNPRFPKVDPTNPENTMYGSRSTGPLAINYAQSETIWRPFAGFPAARCDKIGTLKYPPYVFTFPGSGVYRNDSCWEDKVIIPPTDTSAVDVRSSWIVQELQTFIATSGQKAVLDAINAVAETSGNPFGDSFISYPNGTLLPDGRGYCYSVIGGEASYCIDLDLNLTALGVPAFSNDVFIPGLVINIRRLRILNFHTFDATPEVFELLKPYVPDQYNTPSNGQDLDSRFTLANRLKFTGTSLLTFKVDIDVSVAQEFISLSSPNPLQPVMDTMSLTFQLQNLDIQVLTQTAINSTRVTEVPFYYYLDPFGPEKCLFSIFYQNGLTLPQFQVYVTDIVGPFANITGVHPPNSKPNIFSQGMSDLITSSLELFFQMFKENFPDATQGQFREYVNRVLDDFVITSRDAAGPGSCPPPAPCGDPSDWCAFVNFMSDTFTPILNTLNTAVGGTPVTRSQVDINTLIDLALNYTFLAPTGPMLASGLDIQHPVEGNWIAPEPLFYSNGPSSIKLTNLQLKGLNTIYNLHFNTYPPDPYSLGFTLDIGNGTMLDGSTQPATPYHADRLEISAEFDLIVVATRPYPTPPETLANNAFRVELYFTNINVTSLQQILINKTDLYMLNIDQITTTQCALSVIDKVTLRTISIQIADFDVNIPNNQCETNAACVAPSFGRDPANCRGAGLGKCHIGLAIDQLRTEATATNVIAPPNQSVPLFMINAILTDITNSSLNGFNSLDIWNRPQVNCDVPKVVFNVVSGIYNSTHAQQLFTRLTTNVTGLIKNPGPMFNTGWTIVTVQSPRAGDPNDRDNFINEVIASAVDARGPSPNPSIVLTLGSFCSLLNLPTLLQPVCSGIVDGTGNFSATLKEWTTAQPNLIDQQVSPLVIEDRVRVDVNKDSYYDIRTSTIVSAISTYFDDNAQSFNTLLSNIANKTTLLQVEADGSVSLVINMTEAIFWLDDNVLQGKACDGTTYSPAFLLQDFLGTSNLFIPGLRIEPGLLIISNFGSFSDLIFLRPYVAQGIGARFTTQYAFGWRKPDQPLNISASVDVYYDHAFTRGGHIPSGIEDKETINITMSAQGMLVQALTLLAVNTATLGQTSLGDFLNVDAAQAFKRNCYALTCLATSIFDGGLYIPQITVNVTNIIGPRFQTTRHLFSAGMEMLIDALLELVVQLFRTDLAALTQGPLRDAINNKLISFLADAKAPGACPPRYNYTENYPYGPNFCSYNDSTGVNPLLTQSAAICTAKGNGRLCKWSPPDGAVTPTTVACVYTQESKDLNFKTARGLQQLKSFVNGSLMNPESSLYVNNYLSAFASSVSTKLYEVDGVPLKYNGNDYGTMTLGIGHIVITHLDTLDHLQIFDPTPFGDNGTAQWTNPAEYEPSPANRRLSSLGGFEELTPQMKESSNGRELSSFKQSFGYADNKYMSRTAVGWSAFSFYFEVLYELDQLFVPRPDGPTDFVENHVSIQFNLVDFDVYLDLFMLINIPRLMDLQVRSIGTIYELPCILAIFEDDGLIPTRANITYGSVGFDLNCVDRCDSPLFAPLKSGGFSDSASANLRTSFTDLFRRVTQFLINALASSDAQNFLNQQISISNVQCQAIKTGDLITIPNVGDQQLTDAASAMGIAGLASLFATFVGFALLVPVHFRRRDELMKRALLDAHSRGTQGKSKDEFELAERRLKSAFEHPMMPKVVKFGVPFMIVVNIVLFATANYAAAGAIVEVTLSIAGDTTYPITILAFNLVTSINDMWNAGTYVLGLLIALASGGWPYAKQLLMLFTWFAPSTVLHPNTRGRMMEVLDALGKWSLIDIYVLVMLMVGFRFYISSSLISSFSLLPPDVLVVDVVVTPGWGIFGFVLGAMGSLVVNHIMIWFHRKVVRMDEDLQDAILGTLVKDLRTPRIPLSRHRFNILDAEGRPYRYSVAVRVLFPFLLGVSFVAIIVGAVVPVIIFNFQGVAGLAISLIDPSLATTTYSVASIGTALIQGARNNTASILGILFIQILYILFAIVLPLLLCMLLVVIWVVPLTLREQILLHFVAEVLSAWEALLVLVVSIIAALTQISQLAQFIVNAASGNLCSAFQSELQKIFPDPADANCFTVVASLPASAAIIIAAGIIFFIACIIGFRLIHAAIEDRELAMRRKPPHSPGEMTGLTGFIIRRSLEAFGASQIQTGGSVANLYAQGQGAFDYRDSQVSHLTPANPILAREMPHGIQAPNPMFHGSLGSLKAAHQSIDV